MWRSEPLRSELLSEPLGRPPRRPQPRGRLALEQQLGWGQVVVRRVMNPFILVGYKLNLNLPPQAEVRRHRLTTRDAPRLPLGLSNRRQTHCLECIKDVALDVEEHSREYEPWD